MQNLIINTIALATNLADQAGLKYFNEKMGGQDLWPCGNSIVILNVKANTKIGKELLAAGFYKNYGGGLCKNFSNHPAQCMDVGAESNRAALEVLESSLNVAGYVKAWMD